MERSVEFPLHSSNRNGERHPDNADSERGDPERAGCSYIKT